MSAKNLRIKIGIDADTKELIIIKKEFEKLGNTIVDSSKKTEQFQKRMKSMGHLAAGVYALEKAFYALDSVYNKTIKTGIDFNASMQTTQIGIASLISINSKNITSLDKVVSVQEKYKIATEESAKVVKMLQVANLETSATLPQLIQGFQSAVGPALSAGFSIKQTVEYTKLMTQAAGAMGMPMDQLAQEMRSVMMADIDRNSIVAMNLQITNKQITQMKAQGKLFEFLEKRLRGFALAGKDVSASFTGSMSNMSDAWSIMMGEVTKPVFEDITKGINELTEVIKEINPQTVIDSFEILGTAISTVTTVLVAYKGSAILAKVTTTALATATAMYGRATSKATFKLNSYGAATKRATIAQKALNIAMKANPVGLLATAFILGYEAVDSYLDSQEEAIKKTKELAETDKRLLQLNDAYEIILSNEHLSNEQKEKAIALLNAQAMATVGLKSESEKLITSTNAEAKALRELKKIYVSTDAYSKAIKQ